MHVRRGVTRTVFITKRWAIKVPSLRAYSRLPGRGLMWSITRGIQANLSEWEWRESTGVCPPRWTLAGLVSVYPRCKPAPEDLTREEYDAIGFTGPTDKKPSNVGYWDGELVWIDYDMSWNDCHEHPVLPVPE